MTEYEKEVASQLLAEAKTRMDVSAGKLRGLDVLEPEEGVEGENQHPLYQKAKAEAKVYAKAYKALVKALS